MSNNDTSDYDLVLCNINGCSNPAPIFHEGIWHCEYHYAKALVNN